MLNAFRQGIGSYLVKGLMAFLVAAFVLWGIADVFRNFGASTAAQIGDTKISSEEFRRSYADRVQQIGRRFGRGVTPEQARALGLDRQILGEMFTEIALDQKAKKLGLNVSDQALAEKIQKLPEFAGPNGTFNHDYFVMVLRSNGMNEAQYVNDRRRVTLRQQLGQAIAGDLATPKVMSDAFRRYQNEERSVDFVTLGPKEAGAIPAPSPEQLKSYYEDHKALFRTPEYRKLQMIVLTPEAVAASIEIPEAELKKLYESQKDRFGTPEKREINQIVFDKPEDAAAAAARLASGVPFDTLVSERKLSPKDVSLGVVSKRDILDPAVADAAFALPVGKTSAPVQGRFGTVILLVKKIEPSAEKPYSELVSALRTEASAVQARRQILDLHDKIEDERASGATIPEIANKLKLKYETLDAVDRSGRKPDGTKVDGVSGSAEVLGPAFAAPVGTDNDTVDLKNQGGYVWYDVATVTPSRERTFEEAQPQVGSRWKDEETGKRLAELADGIRAKLDAGQTFAQAAPGIALAHRDKLVRTQTADGFDSAGIARIFETPEGKSGVLEAPQGSGRTVYRVTAATLPATAAAAASTDSALSRGLQDDVLSQYIRRVQEDLGVSVNEAAIHSAIGADRN